MTAPSSAPPSAGSAPAGPGLVLTLLPHRRLVARITFGVAVLTAGLGLLMPRAWSARGSFVAQSGRSAENLGSLAGLASQFGVNLAGAGGGFSPRFFAALVTSDKVLSAIAGDTVRVDSASAPTTVEVALKVKGDTPGIRRQKAITVLRTRVVSAIFDQRIGVTNFSVTTESPVLSSQIAHALIARVNKFTALQLQQHAGTERVFVESRRKAIGAELAAAEEAASGFLMGNRDFSQSPRRKLEYDRLTRRVSELQVVYNSLSQSYEQARIEEVRSTPVLTMVDEPTPPELPDRRGLTQLVLGVAVLAAALSVGLILLLARLGLIGAGPGATPATLAEWVPILARESVRPWRLLI